MAGPAAEGERSDDRLGAIGERYAGNREPAARVPERLVGDGEQHARARDQRAGAHRVAVVEKMAALHEIRRKQAACPAVMLAS
jgi:hypothetical protein